MNWSGGLGAIFLQLENVFQELEEFFFVLFQFGEYQRHIRVHLEEDNHCRLLGIDFHESGQLCEEGLLHLALGLVTVRLVFGQDLLNERKCLRRPLLVVQIAAQNFVHIPHLLVQHLQDPEKLDLSSLFDEEFPIEILQSSRPQKVHECLLSLFVMGSFIDVSQHTQDALEEISGDVESAIAFGNLSREEREEVADLGGRVALPIHHDL